MLLPTLNESKFSITERHRTEISSLCDGHWSVSYCINGKTRCMKTVEVSELQDLPDIIHSALMSMTLWRCEEPARSSLWRKLWRSLVFPDRKMLIPFPLEGNSEYLKHSALIQQISSGGSSSSSLTRKGRGSSSQPVALWSKRCATNEVLGKSVRRLRTNRKWGCSWKCIKKYYGTPMWQLDFGWHVLIHPPHHSSSSTQQKGQNGMEKLMGREKER